MADIVDERVWIHHPWLCDSYFCIIYVVVFFFPSFFAVIDISMMLRHFFYVYGQMYRPFLVTMHRLYINIFLLLINYMGSLDGYISGTPEKGNETAGCRNSLSNLV